MCIWPLKRKKAKISNAKNASNTNRSYINNKRDKSLWISFTKYSAEEKQYTMIYSEKRRETEKEKVTNNSDIFFV